MSGGPKDAGTFHFLVLLLYFFSSFWFFVLYCCGGGCESVALQIKGKQKTT